MRRDREDDPRAGGLGLRQPGRDLGLLWIVVGMAGSQLIETRFAFSPTSLSVAKNAAPPSPDLPASSVAPTSSPARAAPAAAHREHGAGAQQQPLVLVNSFGPPGSTAF